jgi:CheY-like chemotaxis protein
MYIPPLPPTVLQIDDDVDDYLVQLIAFKGPEVRLEWACNVKGGISKAITYQPCLIIVDHLIPDNVVNAVKRIKAKEELQHIPLIVSGRVNSKVAADLLLAGAIGVLPKPIEIGSLYKIFPFFSQGIYNLLNLISNETTS